MIVGVGVVVAGENVYEVLRACKRRYLGLLRVLWNQQS